MVPGEGDCLNSPDELFEVLKDWEYQLKAENIDFEALEADTPQAAGPQGEEPSP